MEIDLDAAERAIRGGELVVYPTETVYGLGADALDPDAIERVYSAKNRPRDRPLSLAVPTIETADDFLEMDDLMRSCMEAFLPGPVTVVGRKRPIVPDALTAGRDDVGVRVPDHPIARRLLDRVAPLTTTSANVSGQPSACETAELDADLRRAVAVVLDGGRTPGGASTVVDPARRVVHRRGLLADEVEAWLADHPP